MDEIYRNIDAEISIGCNNKERLQKTETHVFKYKENVGDDKKERGQSINKFTHVAISIGRMRICVIKKLIYNTRVMYYRNSNLSRKPESGTTESNSGTATGLINYPFIHSR